MILTKYNEIMEKIVVTEEMKKRVLSNIEASSFKTRRNYPVFHSYKRFLSLAACLALLLIGIVSVPKLINTNTGELSTDIFQITEEASLEALEQTVGFDIEVFSSLPFEALQTVYTSYGDGLAEIAYVGENQTLYYRKSPGKEDNSGDYNSYDSQLQLSIGSISVTLKGNDNLFSLAVWTDGQYSYSISLTNAISQEDLTGLIRQLNT